MRGTPVAALAAQVTVLVVFERAVEGCQLAQLQPLVLIAGLICGNQQLLYHLGRIICLHKRSAFQWGGMQVQSFLRCSQLSLCRCLPGCAGHSTLNWLL